MSPATEGIPQERPEQPSFVPQPRRTRRRWGLILRRTILLGLIAISLATTFAASAWFSLRGFVQSVDEVTTPTLTGLTVDEARLYVERLGLTIDASARRADASVTIGKVIEQNPVAGARTKPGRVVRLVVSQGPPQARVPDLLGSTTVRAELAIRQAGLTRGPVATVPDPVVPAGRIVAQNPERALDAFPGDVVSLLQSGGPRAVYYVMPDLVGRDARLIVPQLGIAGWRDVVVMTSAGEQLEASELSRVGGLPIVEQRPETGRRVERGTAVVLVVERPRRDAAPPRR